MLMEHENCPCMETCPLNRAMALIGGKWKMQILCSLYNNGPTRYNQLKKTLDGVKVLGQGELTKKLTVTVAAFSEGAKSKIEAAGGKAEVV